MGAKSYLRQIQAFLAAGCQGLLSGCQPCLGDSDFLLQPFAELVLRANLKLDKQLEAANCTHAWMMA